MIALTVKTLDGRSHDFSVEDECTVEQFKTLAEQKLGVAKSKQRLIFMGKALQDTNRLSEYGVNNKVIHLVERAPPPAASSAASSSGGSARTSGTQTGAPGSGPGGNAAGGDPFLQNFLGSLLGSLNAATNNAAAGGSGDGPAVNVHINMDVFQAGPPPMGGRTHVRTQPRSQQQTPAASTSASSTSQSSAGRQAQQVPAGTASSVGAPGRAELDQVQALVQAQQAQNQQRLTRECIDYASHYLSQACRHLNQLQDNTAARPAVRENLLCIEIPSMPTATPPSDAASATVAAPSSSSSSDASTGTTPAAATGQSTSSQTQTSQTSSSSSTGTASSASAAAISQARGAEVAAIMRTQLAPYLRALLPAVEQCAEILETPTGQDVNVQQVLNSVMESLHAMSHSFASLADLDINVAQPEPRNVTSYILQNSTTPPVAAGGTSGETAAGGSGGMPASSNVSGTTAGSTPATSSSQTGSATATTGTTSTSSSSQSASYSSSTSTSTQPQVMPMFTAGAPILQMGQAAQLSQGLLMPFIASVMSGGFQGQQPGVPTSTAAGQSTASPATSAPGAGTTSSASTGSGSGAAAPTSTSSASAPSAATSASPASGNPFPAHFFPNGAPLPFMPMPPPPPARHQCRAQVIPPVAGTTPINVCSHPRHRTLAPAPTTTAQQPGHIHIMPGVPVMLGPNGPGFPLGFPMPAPRTGPQQGPAAAGGAQAPAGGMPPHGQVHHMEFRIQPDGEVEASEVGGGTGASDNMFRSIFDQVQNMVNTGMSQPPAAGPAGAGAAAGSAAETGSSSSEMSSDSRSTPTSSPSAGQPQPRRRPRRGLTPDLVSGVYREYVQPREGVTVHDILMEIGGETSEDDEDNGPLGVLMSAACRQLSMPDFMHILQGSRAPLTRIAPVLRRALCEEILAGREVNDAALQEVSNEVSANCEISVREALVGMQTRSGVRMCETTLQEIRQLSLTLFRAIHNIDPNSTDYGDDLWLPLRREIGNSLAVLRHGLNGSQSGLHTLLQRLLEHALASQDEEDSASMAMLMPTFYANSMVHFVDGAVAGSSLDQSELDARLVRAVAAASRPVVVSNPPCTGSASSTRSPEATSSTPARAAASPAVRLSAPVTARAEECDLPEESAAVASDATAAIAAATTSGGASRPRPPSAGDDTEEEEWQGRVPASWVPVIAEDIIRQRLTSSRRPHGGSHASASSSSKRRKTSSASKPTVDQKLPTALHKAIRQAGVEPTTSMDEVMSSVAEDTELQQAYEPTLRSIVAERLRSDPTYDAKNHPHLKTLFD